MNLYHATWPTRLGPILDEGLRLGIDGCVYLADDPQHAAQFLALRGAEFVGYTEVILDGKPVRVPDVIVHDEIVVLEVDGDLLDDVQESTDHSAAFFPGVKAYLTNSPIPPEAIVTVMRFTVNRPRNTPAS